MKHKLFRPLFLSIGINYAFSSGGHRFASFIAFLSMLGIMLGVAALIIVCAVMNGLEGDLKERVLSAVPHALIYSADGELKDSTDTKQFLKIPNVAYAMPEVTDEIMVQGGDTLTGAILYGIDPEKYPSNDLVRISIGSQIFSYLEPRSYEVILGADLARMLGVSVGEKIRLVSTSYVRYTPIGRVPSQRLFTVSGIYNLGVSSSTGSYMVLANIDDVKKLMHLPKNDISNVRLWLKDPFSIAEVKTKIEENKSYKVKDWRVTEGEFFQSIAMEKIMMSLMLALIVIVAAFNMLSALIMVVTSKVQEIAILRTLGMKQRTVLAIFMVEGALSGVIGSVLGAGLGLLCVNNISLIMKATGLYYYFGGMAEIPATIDPFQVTLIILLTIILSFVITIYPSWQASRIRPAQSLRYE